MNPRKIILAALLLAAPFLLLAEPAAMAKRGEIMVVYGENAPEAERLLAEQIAANLTGSADAQCCREDSYVSRFGSYYTNHTLVIIGSAKSNSLAWRAEPSLINAGTLSPQGDCASLARYAQVRLLRNPLALQSAPLLGQDPATASSCAVLLTGSDPQAMAVAAEAFVSRHVIEALIPLKGQLPRAPRLNGLSQAFLGTTLSDCPWRTKLPGLEWAALRQISSAELLRHATSGGRLPQTAQVWLYQQGQEKLDARQLLGATARRISVLSYADAEQAQAAFTQWRGQAPAQALAHAQTAQLEDGSILCLQGARIYLLQLGMSLDLASVLNAENEAGQLSAPSLIKAAGVRHHAR